MTRIDWPQSGLTIQSQLSSLYIYPQECSWIYVTLCYLAFGPYGLCPVDACTLLLIGVVWLYNCTPHHLGMDLSWLGRTDCLGRPPSWLCRGKRGSEGCLDALLCWDVSVYARFSPPPWPLLCCITYTHSCSLSSLPPLSPPHPSPSPPLRTIPIPT